ncbi:hypothetical protein ACLIBG_08370 [Virgibacillus sp. W0181]|uniref:hypothetical protein n=1 Tax=Virgibacillus sp. W0181 TaxID=3391581 RepID=UPI003F44FC68
MSHYKKNAEAARNIQQVKGFVCPTCDSRVPRGYEVCYNCGDMPMSGSGYSSSSSGDDGMLGSFFFFWFTFIAPAFYLLSNMDEDAAREFFNLILLLPNLIILISTVVSIVRQRTNLGCLSWPVRIWVLVFSVLTFMKNIQLFLHNSFS